MDNLPIDLFWLPAFERYLRSVSRQALQSPETAMRRVKRKMSKDLEDALRTKEAFFETLAQAYEWMAPRFDELSGRAVDQILADTPRSQFYWALISTANELHPGSPFILSWEHESFGMAKMRAMAALYEAGTCNGSAEQKAHAALHAAAVVLDPYKIYLARLEVFDFLATERFTPQGAFSFCQVQPRRGPILKTATSRWQVYALA